jgi:hypothetical protein
MGTKVGRQYMGAWGESKKGMRGDRVFTCGGREKSLHWEISRQGLLAVSSVGGWVFS